ncbi:MAG: LysM peptidoglycan-binding domain-containing protein [Bacteriovoracaceae bacterium]|nr:LysM peptidoglycan-binding domain-containing protein [Bacteriovoracaceae bacterium]
MMKYIFLILLLINFSCGSAKKRADRFDYSEAPNKWTKTSLTQADEKVYSETNNDSKDSLEESDELDLEHQVAPEESQYTEVDKSEDVIEKLFQDDTVKGGIEKSTVERKFIPIRLNTTVKKWINFFTVRDRARFQRFIDNGARYYEDICEVLKQHGMPQELFFVGLIESGYYLRARSHASAVGPWQFIRATGKRYGLTVGRYIDERNDILKSTHAAARYFRDLYNIFGSWELALSAYNAGEYGILRRLRRSNTSNFYELANSGHLHRETANYVPKVIAAMYIYNHADEYGFNIPQIPSRLKTTVKIPLKHAHEIAALGQSIGLSEEEIFSYNPELLANYTPYLPGKYYELRIPKQTFEESFKTILSLKDAPGVFSTDRSRRRLASQSDRFNNETPIQTKNARANRANVEKQILKWGQASVRKESNVRSEKKIIEKSAGGQILRVEGPLIYQVRDGENLTTISQLFRRAQSQIKKSNRLKTDLLQVGQKIVIPSAHKQYYKVQRGDNLSDVAKKLNTQVSVLIALNRLKGDMQITPGQKLLFFAM